MCPATAFESSGSVIDAEIINSLLAKPDFYALAEMMNFPGVINNDIEVVKKLKQLLIITNLSMVISAII